MFGALKRGRFRGLASLSYTCSECCWRTSTEKNTCGIARFPCGSTAFLLNLSSDWKMHNYSRRQESLADAKVSARQQCVYEGQQRRNLSKSTMCDFLLTLIVTMAALLAVCEICSRIELENRHFLPLRCDCGPIASIAEEICCWKVHFGATMTIGSIIIRLAVLPQKSAKSNEIPRNFGLVAVQGHPSHWPWCQRKRTCNFLLVINFKLLWTYLLPLQYTDI